jgi:hypothetical protein
MTSEQTKQIRRLVGWIGSGTILTIVTIILIWAWKTSLDSKVIANNLAINTIKDDKEHTEFKSALTETQMNLIRLTDKVEAMNGLQKQSLDSLNKILENQEVIKNQTK